MQAAQDLDLATNDLGPLAWVLDELRKSMESASSALRRFVRDAAAARGEDMASVDAGQLRIARQHMHQAVGALEMVGLAAPAHMLRSMESVVQRFVERPELCNEAAAAKVERAGFALTEYLESVLLGKSISAVALFPQYKDVQELAGAERVHPADLWAMDWRWIEPELPSAGQPLSYDPAVRSRMDQAVLNVVKSASPEAARELAAISLGLAQSQTARQPKAFWKIAAGYFEAVACKLLPADVYVKRAASRILLQYASLAKGELGVSDRLAHDLVFFCAQALPPKGADASALTAVRQAYSLAREVPVDYATSPFGRFEPVLLAQARKRIASAKESWSALSGGDTNKLKGVGEQFHLVADTLTKLHPPSAALSQALTSTIDAVVRAARVPSAGLAMEVATAILYLEAAFQELDPDDAQLAARTARLAERLKSASRGDQPAPLESWMEELYRRVSDRQTMGSVVGELRATLSELEKLLDQFFRDPQEKAPLRAAPQFLSQMRGVLSVLGLDQASNAVQRMRETVEEIANSDIGEGASAKGGIFDKLGNNLGALGFLIDMLNYQPALAKKLFVYDEAHGELRPLMGRAEPGDQDRAPAGAAPTRPKTSEAAAVATVRMPAVQPQPAPAVAASPAAAVEEDEEDLRDIFLEEAREVVQNGLAALEALANDPGNMADLTTLRRAFHTLKGSSRMVGLTEFGEAAWSLEQVLNTWLADQKQATEGLRTLSTEALNGFAQWIEDIARQQDAGWKSSIFRAPADAMRMEQRLVPLVLPEAPAKPQTEAAQLTPDFASLPDLNLQTSEPEAAPRTTASAAPKVPEVMELALEDFAPNVSPKPSAPVEAKGFAAGAQGFDTSGLSLDAAGFSLESSGSSQASQPSAVGDPFAKTQPVMASQVSPAPDFDFEVTALPEAAAVLPPLEMGGIDFDSLAAASGAQPAEAPAAPSFDLQLDTIDLDGSDRPVVEAGVEVDFDELSQESAEAMFDFAPTQPPQSTSPEAAAPLGALPAAQATNVVPIDASVAARDEQVKVIGPLRIGIPLYNVYLNEADEWSRRLATEVSEWALQVTQPVSDAAVGLAHALGGSSATVGFRALSDVARALESALQHTQSLAYGTPQHAKAFIAATDEIRRLLHQFAAGFLKEPDIRILQALEALKDLSIPQRSDLPEGERLAGEAPQEPFEAAEPPRVAHLQQHTPMQPHHFAPVQQPSATARDVHLDGADDIDAVDAVDADLFPIFEEEAQELMPQLAGALRQWAERPDHRDARDQILRALHTLKGSARLTGALRLGEMAHRMESAIEHLGTEGVSPADIDDLLQRFDHLQAQFEALRVTDDFAAPPQPAAPAPILQKVQQAAPVQPSQPPAAFGPAVQAAPPLPEPLNMPAPVATAAPVAAPAPLAMPAPSATPGGQPAKAAAPTRATVPDASAPRVHAPTAAPLAPASAPASVIPAPVAAKASMHATPAAVSTTALRQAANQAVRVRSQLLDRLVNQAGEVMITRSRLETELKQLRGSLNDLTGNLDRLRGQLRDIELQAETQMQSRMAQAKDIAAGFDPLEFDRFTRVQELTRMMAESVNDVATVQRNIQRVVESTEDDLIAQARQTRELQRDLLRTRMVEFEGISERLYRVVRLAAKETAKQVKLDIVGGTIEMDRGVLDRMTPAFEHLLRNCVAHGIEEPQTRTAAGKNPTGQITVNLSYEGNDVSVEFHDDGAGLDLPRIREKALQQGLITSEHRLTEAEAANLIFMPGFSTASHVTELAGRGVGMDVVRSEVNGLGGRIETSTQQGRGTTFKLVLPLTTAVTQVVMMRAGALSIGVPANLVETVRRVPLQEVQQSYGSGFFAFGEEQLPFRWLGALLQSSAASNEAQQKTLSVVIFRSAAQRVAVHVDDVLGNQEVVVKNLGPQLSRLPGLAGMTVLASGAVVLIYNPVALIQVYGDQALSLSNSARGPSTDSKTVQPVQPIQQPAVAAIPLVLVVDDSITVRRVTQRLLQREGYRVALAADGLQALERLAEERPAVVLSDIEMPRMDGFDLARNIRADARLKDLPIVMITSRIAEKHREHAVELGVNHYLGKPYSEAELLSLVKHYSVAEEAA